jgi:acetyl esterase/lipase
LRALAWLKKRGHQRVAIVGESAGANLASMAIALLHNPALFEEFGREVNEVAGSDMLRWGYPSIFAFSCWYGIMDKHSWKDGGGSFFGINQGRHSFFKRALQRCFDLYASESGLCFGNKLTFDDIKDSVQSFCPHVLFIVAAHDPLGLHKSCAKAAETLSKIGAGSISKVGEVNCRTLVFESTHGFVSFPPQLQEFLGIDSTKGCQHASRETIAFLISAHAAVTGSSLPGKKVAPRADKDELSSALQTYLACGLSHSPSSQTFINTRG